MYIEPNDSTCIGTFLIDVTLSDGVNHPVSTFTVVIIPDVAPIFTSSLIT